MRTSVRIALLVAVLAAGIGAAPASAADCVSGTTNWTNAGGGNWKNASNWSNGVPTADCDARITLAGDYGVAIGRAPGTGAVARSLKVGGASGSQVLVLDNTTCGAATCDFDPGLYVGEGGIDVNGHGTIKLVSAFLSSVGPIVLDGGRLRGVGDVFGSVQNAGRVILGPNQTMMLFGDYTTTADGSLAVDVPAQGSADTPSQLFVNGNAALDGSLTVTGGAPARASAHPVASFGDLTGTFSDVRFSGPTYPLTYVKNGVVLGGTGTCTTGTTNWVGTGLFNDWYDPSAWDHGVPSANCDAVIASPDEYAISLGDAPAGTPSGDVARSITLSAGNDDPDPNYLSINRSDVSVGAGGVTVNPDVFLVLGPGQALHVKGNYTQKPGANLGLVLPPEPTPATSPKLTVDGKTTLDGALALYGGGPALTSTLRIIDAPGGRSGTFSHLNFDSRNYDVLYTDKAVDLGPATHCISGTTTWTNAAGGDWNDPHNWTNGVPTGTCFADIGVDGTYTVTVPAAAAMSGLGVGASTGTVTASVGHPADVTIGGGGIQIRDHGVLSIGGGTLHTIGGYNQTGGTLAMFVAPDGSSSPSSKLVVDYENFISAGTLAVSGGGPPKAGEQQLVQFASLRHGEFSAVTFADQTYDVRYADDGVYLAKPLNICRSGTTEWTNSAGGDWNNPNNWSVGTPTAGCDAKITLGGTYTVRLGSAVGADGSGVGEAKSLTLGGSSGKQTLLVDNRSCAVPVDCEYKSTLVVGSGGVAVGPHGVVSLRDGLIGVEGAFKLDGGRIEGDGQLAASPGLTNAGGTIAVPAGPATNNDEVLILSGDYVQNSAATLAVELVPSASGLTSSWFAVNGSISLDGKLAVSGTGPAGATLPAITTTNGRTGTFATTTFTDQVSDVIANEQGVYLKTPKPDVCPSGEGTAWLNPQTGDWEDPANWSNGVPSADCNAVIQGGGGRVVRFHGATGTATRAAGGPDVDTLVVYDDVTLEIVSGTLHVGGDLAFGSYGKLKVDGETGAGFPAVDAAGFVNLTGNNTLVITGAPTGDVSRVINATSRTGTFATTSITPAGMQVAYDDTGVLIQPGPTDATAPVLWNLSAHPKDFTGTTQLRFKVSEASTVTISVASASSGRAVAATAKAKAKRKGKAKHRALALLTTAARPGRNTFRLDARCRTGGLCLAAGRYTLTLVATDAAGNISSPKTLTVRVKRRSSR